MSNAYAELKGSEFPESAAGHPDAIKRPDVRHWIWALGGNKRNSK